MLNKQITNLPKSTVSVKITAPWADMAILWQQTLQTMSADLELPGFRKGSAPLDMVENHLGVKLQEEVIKAAMPQALMSVLQGTDITPIDYPQYQNVAFAKGSDLSFEAVFPVRPTITLGDYKAIKVARPAAKVITDEDITKVLQDVFTRWKQRQPQDPNTPTEPNDRFALAVGASSVNDLKLKIKQDLESESKYYNELDYEEAILVEVEKLTTVDVPDVLINDEINRMLVSLQRRVSDTGMLMDDYLKSQGKTLEGLKAEWQPQALGNVKKELGLSEVARLENVNISDEELKAEIDKIQDAKLKAQFEMEEPRLHLRHSLRQVKTLNLLKDLVSKA